DEDDAPGTREAVAGDAAGESEGAVDVGAISHRNGGEEGVITISPLWDHQGWFATDGHQSPAAVGGQLVLHLAQEGETLGQLLGGADGGVDDKDGAHILDGLGESGGKPIGGLHQGEGGAGVWVGLAVLVLRGWRGSGRVGALHAGKA